MKIQKYTKISTSILLTLLLSYGLVSAWTNLSSVTTGDQLTATVWNDMATKLNDAGQRASGIFTDGSSNVGIGNSSPNAKLEVTGDFIRTIAYSSSNGPGDDTDNGQIVSRVLTFNKKKANTKIRINYNDNFRVYGGNLACTWEIKIDGSSCTQAIFQSIYTNSQNEHRNNDMLGYCTGIGVGSHQIQVWVNNTQTLYPGGNCFTGGFSGTWTIEAEEVN